MRFNEFFQPQNLNEFARNPRGDDDGGEDPYKYPKPQHYSRSIEFFGKFEADHFDREDTNDTTGEFKGYWGKTQIAYFKFDNPAKTGSDDSGIGWYYEPESDNHSDSTNASPVVNRDEERKQQELGMIDAFLKSGKKPNPGSPIYHLMKRHGFVDNVGESRESISKSLLREFPIAECAGYIAQTPEEAKDPRFSMSMTVDVGIHTMQEQLAAFFPTTAPKDGQSQVQEATYHGREVTLGIPVKQGQHYFVYQRDPITQKVKKVIHKEPVKKVKQVRQRHPR